MDFLPDGAPNRDTPATDADMLRMVLQIGRTISSQLGLKPLINEVLEQSTRMGIAHRRTFWLYDPDYDELYTFIGEGLAEEIRVPADRGIVGVASRQNKIVNIQDAYESSLFNPDVDKQTGYTTRSTLAIPMLGREGQLLGCFQAINRLNPDGELLDLGDPDGPVGVGPFTMEDEELLGALAGYAGVAVENAQLYAEQKRMFNSMIVTLAQSVDARDLTTSNHTKLVTGIAVAIAMQMGLAPEMIERIRIAAILHDYGKIGVADEVLNKPGIHTPEERQMMRSHCIKSILILSRIEFQRELRDIPAIAGMHHEYLDGSGYPFGLKGIEIPLEGRILAVADIFQALTQTRPYKDGMSPQSALAVLQDLTEPHIDRRSGKECGQHLDPLVIDALRETLEENEWDMEYFEQTSGWERMLAGELV